MEKKMPWEEFVDSTKLVAKCFAVCIRVETNPHQTLIRLNNKIVSLSRSKVGFNPVMD